MNRSTKRGRKIEKLANTPFNVAVRHGYLEESMIDATTYLDFLTESYPNVAKKFANLTELYPDVATNVGVS